MKSLRAGAALATLLCLASCQRGLIVTASLLPNEHLSVRVTEPWSGPPCVDGVWITRLDPERTVWAINRREGGRCAATFEYPSAREGYAFRIGGASSTLTPGRYEVSVNVNVSTSDTIIVVPSP